MKLITNFATLNRLLVLASILVLHILQSPTILVLGYTRDDFPSTFIFGSGSSAYQVEGAASEDGRTPSILDNLTHIGAFNGATGDIACDEYHKYKEDVQLMVDMGLDAYRFSISWSRLIPNGRGPVNPIGVEYYNNLINELINHGIQPHVTLMHFDPPQALEDAYRGWLNQQIVKDFTTYADICFHEFGDRVLHWTTINEPNCYASQFTMKSPYVGAHNLLLGHASVVNLYRKKYEGKQHGSIGLSICTSWYIPETDTKEDLIAVERANDFTSGWFMHPLVFGDYPHTMKHSLRSQLPSFTKQEAKLLRGSFDFIGVITYSTSAIKDDPNKPGKAVKCREVDIGGKFVQGVFEHFKQAYGNPPIYMYENGLETPRNDTLNDTSRMNMLSACIGSTLDALRNGSNVKGYFQWSFLDLFEIPTGYETAYGLYYVDLDDPNLRRYPKLSAHWYSSFLKGKRSFNLLEMKNASETLLQKRQLLEGDSKIKLLLKGKDDLDESTCRCTVEE